MKMSNVHLQNVNLNHLNVHFKYQLLGISQKCICD